MKKRILFLSALLGMLVSATPLFSKTINADLSALTNAEYEASYHLAQMNASKKLLQNYDGSGVKVAVIDSGIDIDHEEFLDSSGNTIISDLSVYVNTTNYYNLSQSYSGNRTTWLNALNDTSGHGTHVASIIAAQANGRGIVGLASKVELIIIKLETNSQGLYEYATIRNAISYAYTAGADVVNISIAGADTTDYYSSIISSYDSSFGIAPIIVAAAGNDNTNTTYYPACATNVISVAASSKANYDEPASFTNYGTGRIDFAAPGYTYAAYNDGSYREWQGTSFASPLVASLAALYKQKYPTATRSEFISALQSSATQITETSKTGWTGKGLVDGDKLLNISNATALTLSAPKYPSTIYDPMTSDLIEQVLDLSDIGWKFDVEIEPYPSNCLLSETHYVSTTNANVIKISGDKLEVVGPGSATIRVEAVDDSSVYGEITLTVQNSDETSSNPLYINTPNGTSNLTADSDGSLSISYATGQYDTWKSGTATWAYDDNDYFTGEDDYFMTGSYDGGGYKAYLQVINYSAYSNGTYPYVVTYRILYVTGGISTSVESVSLNTNSVTLDGNETVQLNATVLPSDASNKNVTWSTSDDSIASVNDSGLVTAHNAGTATITVITQDGSKTATCTVTVNPTSVSSVSLNTNSVTLAQSSTMQLTATISPDIATNKNVTWSSNNTSVASVSNTGLVTANAVGNATITVTTEDGSKTATCTVTVVKNASAVISEINSAKAEFAEVRVDPTDLSSIEALISTAQTDYNALPSANKASVTNSSYIAAMNSAIDFLENHWYGVVRVQLVSRGVKKAAGDWSICDVAGNSSEAESLLTYYDGLSSETKEILATTYDVTASDGTVIRVGQSIEYISNLLAANEEEASTNALVVKQNTNMRSMALIIGASVMLSILLATSLIFIIKRKNVKNN